MRNITGTGVEDVKVKFEASHEEDKKKRAYEHAYARTFVTKTSASLEEKKRSKRHRHARTCVHGRPLTKSCTFT